jgi:hypothetical protein
MKTYSIEPATKKSIEIVETWCNEDGVCVQVTDIWRWGKWFITCDEQLIDELRDTPDGTTTVLSDYDVEMDYVDDGVGRWVDVASDEDSDDDADEAIKEEFERILDDDGYWGIEEAGWEFTDSETYIHGEMIIKEVE